jgi:hypothetical protein
MPAKIGNVSADFLTSVALPQHAATYTVISHKFVMDTVKEELNNHGFFISEESYRATPDGQIASGLYRLSKMDDPELSMGFAWTNSYNKQVKFKAVVGAISTVNEAFMILGNQGAWVRKHTGTADTEAKDQIIAQIQNAQGYYNQLIADKNFMKALPLAKAAQAKLLGTLYADYCILESTTASVIKQQMLKPGFFYAGGTETLWAFYNHVIYAIQDNHPKTWLEEQRMLHYIITNEYSMNQPVVVAPVVSQPAIITPVVMESPYVQLDLEDAIKKAESETMEEEVVEQNIEEEYELVEDFFEPLSIESEDEEEEEEEPQMEEELEAIDFHNTVTQEVEETEEEELLIAEDSEDEDEDDHSYFL